MSRRSDPIALLVTQDRLRRTIAALDCQPPATAPWWSLGKRRAATQEMELRAAERARRQAQLNALGPLTSEARRVAKRCIDAAWISHRKGGDRPWQHPYALDDLTTAASAVCVTARSEIPGTDVFASDLPSVAEAITVETIEAYVRERVHRTHTKATDPAILSKRFHAEDGKELLVLQHQATGIRALFTVDVETGFGSVLAKSFEIPTIDHGKMENDHQVDRWFGLGVGTRLYRRAAEEFPQVRWGRSVTQDPSNGVRRKLHAEDPWRWAVVRCAWCREHLPNQDWREAQRADFCAHARTEAQ